MKSNDAGPGPSPELKGQYFAVGSVVPETEYLTFLEAIHREPCLDEALELAMARPETSDRGSSGSGQI